MSTSAALSAVRSPAFTAILVAAFASGSGACSDDDTQGTADTAADTTSDTTPDATPDTTPDVDTTPQPDTAPDIDTKVAPDTAEPDTAPDIASDTSPVCEGAACSEVTPCCGGLTCAEGTCVARPAFVYVARPAGIAQAEAEAYCVSTYGAHLASIHSVDDNAAIDAVVPCTNGVCATPWIGGVAASGFCGGAAGTYGWTDGSAWDYANWRVGTGEPNCSDTPGCLQFWPAGAGAGLSGWNDVRCDALFEGFVCLLP